MSHNPLIFQLICNIKQNNLSNLEETILRYKPLSISIEEGQLIALFDKKHDIKIAISHRWQILEDTDWQYDETIMFDDLKIHCPNTVLEIHFTQRHSYVVS